MDDQRLRSLASREGDAVHETVLGDLKGIWSSLPAIISQDSDGHTAQAMSAVRLAITNLDGSITMTNFPIFDTSPVHYPGGGGLTHTHPVKTGDEGVMQFMSRAQDLWHQMGGTQDPIDARSHHLSDSRWLPGGRSDPRKLNPAPSTSSSQSRSDDGNHVVDVHPQNGISHVSTAKVLQNVGGSNGSGTMHLPDKILKNAPKVLINCMQAAMLPPPGNSFANKKLIATKALGAMGPMAGQISSILSGVMSGGIGSLLSSPTASSGASLTSAITSAVSQVTSALGSSGSGVVSALTGSGGLSTALTSLLTGASSMSGATSPVSGNFGLTDVLNHATSLTQFFGTTAPTSVALSTVLAPLNPANIALAQSSLTSIINMLIAGTISPAAGVSEIEALTTTMSALLPAANTAITTLQTASPALTLAQLAGSAGISLDPNELAVASAISSPTLTALTSALAENFALSASDLASIASFPDSNAAQPGATGAF